MWLSIIQAPGHHWRNPSGQCPELDHLQLLHKWLNSIFLVSSPILRFASDPKLQDQPHKYCGYKSRSEAEYFVVMPQERVTICKAHQECDGIFYTCLDECSFNNPREAKHRPGQSSPFDWHTINHLKHLFPPPPEHSGCSVSHQQNAQQLL